MPTSSAFIEIEELNAIALARDEVAADEIHALPARYEEGYGTLSPATATIPTEEPTKQARATITTDEPTKQASPLFLVGLMVITVLIGTTLTIVTKLQTIPMKNYPAALNIESVIVYIPIGVIYAAILQSRGRLSKTDLVYPWSLTTAVASIVAIGSK